MKAARSPFVSVALFVTSSALATLAVACDDINRPMAVPRSEVRRSCFTDVECPSSTKCVKGPNDVQGICEPRDGSGGGADGAEAGEDGGAPLVEDGGAPAEPRPLQPGEYAL